MFQRPLSGQASMQREFDDVKDDDGKRFNAL